MPEPAADDPFDLEKLRQLGELMEKHGLSEISLRKGSEHWRLRRGSPDGSVGVSLAPPMMPMLPAAQPSAPPSATAASGTGGDSGSEHLLEIKSPTVGTFYASPSPSDPPFVAVGSKVTPSTIVCLIEAMKVFNQIPADVTGTIAAVLVNNGDPVEFGQPLFKVRP
jgi:acetyl-CoA carboxylase biotin carboxyl carrier protein